MLQSASNLKEIANSGDHRIGDGRAPAKYKDSSVAQFRNVVVETISRLNWAFIGTLSQSGWPATSSSRFVLDVDDASNPVTYVIVSAGGLAEAHIKANPRVGFEAHLAVGWLERRKARAVQIQALASFVEDEGRLSELKHLFRSKYSKDNHFTLHESDVIVELMPLSIVNFFAAGRPQWGYIDYTMD